MKTDLNNLVNVILARAVGERDVNAAFGR